MARHRVLVSAHRCGYAELGPDRGLENTLAALDLAATAGADYCEFDVRRCADGTFVAAHDPDVGAEPVAIRRLSWLEVHERAPGVLLLADLLEALSEHGLGAHVDVKFETAGRAREAGESWEGDLLDLLVAHVDPARIVLTTGRRNATRAMRRWIDDHGAPVLVGMSVGASLAGLGWREMARSIWGQLAPRARFEDSEADAIAAHYALAMFRLTRWTTRIGVPLLVWTVDNPRLQRRLLRDHRVWMITTNYPACAVRLRDGTR
ncbi:MAG: glycerophosphodiester phosphodiesterase [Nocardioides sp.]